MALKRPTGRGLTSAQLTQVQDQISKQTTGSSFAQTSDPEFPTFRITSHLGERVIIYVPSFTTGTEEDGDLALRADRPFFHTVNDGSSKYPQRMRCIQGIVNEAAGLDGTCPMCEQVSSGFELAALLVEEEASRQNLDGMDKENEQVKAIRRRHYGNRPIGNAEQSFTFPIVIFEREKDPKTNKKGFVADANGNPVASVEWYTISERNFARVWGDAFAAINEDEEEVPSLENQLGLAGRFFELRVGDMQADGTPPSARDAGRDMRAIHRKYPALNDKKGFLDGLAEAWTPVKAQEVIYNNNIYTRDDIIEAISDTVAQMDLKLQVLRNGNNGIAGSTGASLDALAGAGQSSGLAIEAGIIDDDEA